MPPAPLTDEQHRALGALNEERLVADLVALVQAPSVTGTDVESDQQHAMAATFAQLGLDTDLWTLDLDQSRADADFPGIEAERAEGYGLVGTSAGEGEPALILQGYIDVDVPRSLVGFAVTRLGGHR
ncbi:hypothetical protein [Nostocoides australiense]